MKCNKDCSNCTSKVHAEVVNAVSKKTDKERFWHSFFLFLSPVLAILFLAILATIALKIFFFALPFILLCYVGAFVYKRFLQ